LVRGRLKLLVVWHSWHWAPKRPPCTSFSAWQAPQIMAGFLAFCGLM
jgi:hypothetical protein